MKILMVEDTERLAEAMEKILKANHYLVDLALDGESGLDLALTATYDMIILDVMLPKLDGISLLKELRSNGISTPVILLTSKSESGDKILGLDSGADDYLTKPFVTDELLARLRALGRRKEQLLPADGYSFSDIVLERESLTLRAQQKSIKLTKKEHQLMEFLILRKGFVTSKSMIIDKIWGYDSDVDEHSVETYISFLRKKLKLIQAQATIQSERGAGYLLKE